MATTVSSGEQVTTVIRPARGWQAINLREVWRYRDLLLTLAERDVKLRYRQTALGVIWVVLQPLVTLKETFVTTVEHLMKLSKSKPLRVAEPDMATG